MAVGKLLRFVLAASVAMPASAQLVTRPSPHAGRIVSAKGGEQARLVTEQRLRNAVPRQDLKPGDVLRTNASGTLAVVFADSTQVRLGRNTVLVVKSVSNGAPTGLRLEQGSFWGRAPRGRAKLSIETPSATAAIRGTDWSLEVTAGQTELQVFDGAIDFFNEQGSLQIITGQAALARLGSAPSRILTVQSKEREQMQYYFPADGAFEFFSPSDLSSSAAREERARVLALQSAARTAEDWLVLAETGMLAHPRAERIEAIRRLEGMSLSPPQRGRLHLLQAWRAAQERDYARARDLFDLAMPDLAPGHALSVRYVRYVAAVLAEPELAATLEPPAAVADSLGSWMGQAYLAAYAGDLAGARVAAEEASRRFPDRPEGPAVLAALAMLLDDKEAIDKASAEALRRDPKRSDTLAMRGNYELDFNYRAEAAQRLYEQALENAPTDPTVLSSYSESLARRGATRAAEAALRKAIAENPKDPLLRVNHAILLLDENRMAEARREIDKALELDPTFATAQAVRARHALQMGQAEQGFPDALAGSAANPSGADSLLILAMLYYRRGEHDLAFQQIDAADRLDPAGPLAPLVRAAVALDRMEIDIAITAAREAQRRSVALGGDFANLSQSSNSGGYIASSFRAIELDDWGRFYGDRLFEPFNATGYFDRIVSGTPNPFLTGQSSTTLDPEHNDAPDALSNLMQGLAIEPLAIASSERDLQLFPEQFTEASLGAEMFVNGDDVRLGPRLGVQALRLEPVPVAINLSANLTRRRGPQGAQDDRRDHSGTALISAELTPYDKIALVASVSNAQYDLPGERPTPRQDGTLDARSRSLLMIYSHEFGRRSVLTVGSSFIRASSRIRRRDLLGTIDPALRDLIPPGVPVVLDADIRQRAKSHSFMVSYAANLGRLDVNLGAAFPVERTSRVDRSTYLIGGVPTPVPDTVVRARSVGERYHLDLRYVPNPDLVLQGQIASSESVDGRVVDWRIGGAAQLVSNHWLRAGWFRETNFGDTFTLAPTRTVGMIPNTAPLPEGYRAKTLAVRWDGEWNAHLFTAVEYQRQRFGALGVTLPQYVAGPFSPYVPPCDLSLCSLTYLTPALDRLSVSANAWIPGGFGVSASFARNWSRLPDVVGGGSVPFVPRHSARVGLAWQSPSRITAQMAVTYSGSRRAELLTGRLDGFISADAAVEWESADGRWLIGATATNIFDRESEIVSGVPGFGRSASLSATVRF